MPDTHDGGCVCGSVRYRVSGQPVRTSVCHCRYCQQRTGSAFGLSVYFPDAAVEFLSGETKSYRFRTESGRTMTNSFCTNCGTTVSWTLDALPGCIGIAGGTFDPPVFWFPLEREIFTRSAAPFVHIDVPVHHPTSPMYAPIGRDDERAASQPRNKAGL